MREKAITFKMAGKKLCKHERRGRKKEDKERERRGRGKGCSLIWRAKKDNIQCVNWERRTER